MKSYRDAINFISYRYTLLALADALENGNCREEKLEKLISRMFDNINKKIGGKNAK